jgi:HSP20 family protein
MNCYAKEEFMSNLPWRSLRPNHASDLTSRDPFASLDRMMSHFFDGWDRPWPKNMDAATNTTFVPAIDLREGENEIAVTAELPGIDEKDIHVTVNTDSITIRGEKKFEKKSGDKDRYYVERSYGTFQRTLPLPCEVDRERTEATFRKGVLEVHMPKSSAARTQSRQVPIKG